jgi:hypothetical protein
MARNPSIPDPVRDARLREIAIEYRIVDDTIDYLRGIKSHLKAQLRGELERLEQRSSTTLVRGVTLQLKPFVILVCTCHGIDGTACPNVTAGLPVAFAERVNGDYLAVAFDEAFPRAIVARYDTPAA